MTKATLPGRHSTARKTSAIDRELARFEAANAAFAAAARAAGVPQAGQPAAAAPVRSDARVLLSVGRAAPRAPAITETSFQDTQQGPLPMAPMARGTARIPRRAAAPGAASTALEWFGGAPRPAPAHAAGALPARSTRPTKARTGPAVLLSATVAAALAAALVPSFALRNPASTAAPRPGVALVAPPQAAATTPAAPAAQAIEPTLVATAPAAAPVIPEAAPAAAAAPAPVSVRAQAPGPVPARAVAAIVPVRPHVSSATILSAQERADRFLAAAESSAPTAPDAAPATASEAAPQ